jgi:hypothetical protein
MLSLDIVKATEMSAVRFRIARIRSSNCPVALFPAGAPLALQIHGHDRGRHTSLSMPVCRSYGAHILRYTLPKN